jgi:hypothetical protein
MSGGFGGGVTVEPTNVKPEKHRFTYLRKESMARRPTDLVHFVRELTSLAPKAGFSVLSSESIADGVERCADLL